MGGSVTYCVDCKACNWAGEKKCTTCGGKLEPTLHEIFSYLYTTDSSFKKMANVIKFEKSKVNKK